MFAIKQKGTQGQTRKQTILFLSHSTGSGRGDFDYLIQLSDRAFLEKNGLDIGAIQIKRLFYIASNSDCKDLLESESQLREKQGELTYFKALTSIQRRGSINHFRYLSYRCCLHT